MDTAAIATTEETMVIVIEKLFSKSVSIFITSLPFYHAGKHGTRQEKGGNLLRNGVAFAIVIAMLYEILYQQTGNRLYHTARKIFVVVAGIGVAIEIFKLL